MLKNHNTKESKPKYYIGVELSDKHIVPAILYEIVPKILNDYSKEGFFSRWNEKNCEPTFIVVYP